MKMIKKNTYLLLIFSFLFIASTLKAQEAATVKGDVLLDIGVGFIGGDYNGYRPGNYGIYNNWNYSNSANKIQLPTFSASLQKAFWNDVTIGGQVAFNIFGQEHDLRQNDGYYQHAKYTQTNMYFLGRGEYHFNRLIGWERKYDLYAGALAGMRVSLASETQLYEGWGVGQSGTWRNDYPNRSSTNVGPAGGIFGGIRYYFGKNVSVYAELGYGVTAIRTGLAWRL